MRAHTRRRVTAGLILGTLGAVLPAVQAGGSPENVLLIIDPSNNDSLYVGNYYKNARDIPDSNVLFIAPGATNYPSFVSYNLAALAGSLANRDIADHIDYVVLTPGSPFYVSAPGLVSDACYPVSRFSISAAYTSAFIADEILGGLPATTLNRYYRSTDEARAFDSSVAWLNGAPSTNPAARRYLIGALLGYSGSQGNTLAETLAMIDRSVAADGTRPGGTFYYMNNTADPNRNVRATQFPAAVSSIIGLGGNAAELNGVLPTGHYDCLGIMTGAASPPILTADMTILPGAFGDHLTSWAATFDIGAQTKVAAWITKGTSGSWGTVEEPCNYPGKFPHARLHVFYFQGLSLGEAAFRSAAYFPFQGLLYGDPLTRPFAHLPSVAVDDAPTGPVSGAIVLTPTATTTHPSATIAQFDLLIDGGLYDSATPGGNFVVDTTALTDGWHDLRVLACDNTLVKSTGRWLGSLTVNNHGRAVSLDATPLTGDWATPFVFDVSAAGDPPLEVRVVQSGRVLAAAPGSAATLTVHGLIVGAGPVHVQAEALYINGRIVRSDPLDLTVTYAGGTPSGQPPVAYGFTKRVLKDQPFVVELPATFDNSGAPLTYQVLSGPAQATVPAGQTGPYRLMQPAAGAKGLDAFTFRVTSAAGDSNIATVTLDYDLLRGDLNCDGSIDFGDINPFVLYLSNFMAWQAAYPACPAVAGDINGDGSFNFGDINPFVALLTGGWSSEPNPTQSRVGGTECQRAGSADAPRRRPAATSDGQTTRSRCPPILSCTRPGSVALWVRKKARCGFDSVGNLCYSYSDEVLTSSSEWAGGVDPLAQCLTGGRAHIRVVRASCAYQA